MGKAKTQRTEALMQAARRYTLAKQAEGAIEQHNLNKLIEQGLIVFEPTGNPEIYDYDPEYRRTTEPRRLTMKDLTDAKRAINQEYEEGGASRKALPPRGAGSA